MATLHKEILIGAHPEDVWSAIRDVGALHTRLVPGHVADTVMEGETRIVRFADGSVVREPILSVDDERFRLAWAARSPRLEHYNAVLQVFEAPEGACRVVWTSDLLPHALAGPVGAVQDRALACMKRTLERVPAN
jgi:hypothetical protein